jgi:hypothetical protein
VSEIQNLSECENESLYHCDSFNLETEADETQSIFCDNMETVVIANQRLELSCQHHLVPDVVLQALYTIRPQYHPQLQGAEATGQRDLPVLQQQGK